ncbi:MAG: hypothetical protein G01um101470_720 [Parcubacteria group bacterium Gr01-1014_70]|nr:MAG: hypothetical protein G01um101470_720 [Parcubacteria group bacterium Gr01-1014_70]
MAEIPEIKEMLIKLDKDALQTCNRLHAFVQAPNLASSIYSIVEMTVYLYDLRIQGYDVEIVVRKNGETVNRLFLPNT